uniref:Sugar phosphate phosphatase n=1 Tax=Romanomermis culicivorax TaxID=13658 RepID=A0A915JL85_ROMCU
LVHCHFKAFDNVTDINSNLSHTFTAKVSSVRELALCCTVFCNLLYLISSSFAYVTIKDRIPIILTKVIDVVGLEDLKSINHHLSELRYRLTTDKPLLDVSGYRKDVSIWNQHLKDYELQHGTENTWFRCPWLLAECYMYRKIVEAFDLSVMMKQFDPFQFQKEESFIGCLEKMAASATYLKKWEDTKEQKSNNDTLDENIFNAFLQISLWGNKFDLSISAGAIIHHVSPLDHAQELHPFILCDDSSKIYEKIRSEKFSNRRLDIILDNAGLELFGDLCLAEYFLKAHLVQEVHFHVKSMPWFVSDVTHDDFTWTLEMLRCNESPILKHYGRLWSERVEKNQFRVMQNDFWTYSSPYRDMKSVAPSLYNDLTKSDLLIFKGDLNYRKLAADLKWPFSTSFREALDGFEPAPLVALRTLKADVVVGISDEISTEAASKDKNWMINGNYAVIQYLEPMSTSLDDRYFRRRPLS